MGHLRTYRKLLALDRRIGRETGRAFTMALAMAVMLAVSVAHGLAQLPAGAMVGAQKTRQGELAREAAMRSLRVRRFLAGRQAMPAVSFDGRRVLPPAALRIAARRQHLAILNGSSLAGGTLAADTLAAAQAQSISLSASWQAVGPAQIASAAYGKVTGRVTSIGVDPSDASGNTVYLGTTGGGVWKSVNAAGAASSVSFAPLTDTLPVFSGNADTAAVASLSIGAVTVQPGGTGVLLAGTGDPNDALDSYYGSGILRSADGGLTWTLIQNSHDGVAGNHSFVGEGFAGFAWSAATPGLVIAAVSQASRGQVVNAGNAGYSVQGLYYSNDAGLTWQMGTIQDGSQIVQSAQSNFASYEGNPATSVVWNSVRQRFYAAVRFHGYYESVDGITWTRLASQPGANLTTTNCPVNPNSPGSPACPIFRGALAAQGQTGDLFALTVDYNNLDQGLWQDVCARGGSGCASSTVTFARQLNATPLEAGPGDTTIAQGDYNLWLAALPAGSASSTANDTLLFAGTEDIYRCALAAGCSLRNTTNSNSCAAAKVAGSQHAVDSLAAPAGTAGPLLYFGNDGGLWRSTDGVNQQAAVCSSDDAAHYQNLNGSLGSLAEVVSVAQNPTDGTQLIVGVGANGSASSVGATSAASAWAQLSTGEGGVAAIDPVNPLNWYITTAGGVSISACAQGSACAAADFTGLPAIGDAQVSGDEAVLDAPYILDPGLTSNVIVGTCRVWRGPASGGSAWSSSNVLSLMFDGAQQPFCSGNSLVRSLAAGGFVATANGPQNSGSEVLYAGMAGVLDGGGLAAGHLFTTTTANTASGSTRWTDTYSSLVTNDIAANRGQFNPGAFDISSIFADPHDATGATVYATVMGFSGNGVSAPHLYRSTDGGAVWVNITGNLPNTPANSVVVDPNDANTVYVALDTGVYVTQQVTTCSTPTVNCWTVFGAGLPNAPATQLTAMAGGNPALLRVATYGRGVWEIPLLTSVATQAAMQLAPTSLAFASQQVQTSSASQTITVTNSGTAALTVSSLALTGDFSQTNTCVASSPIAVGGTCSVQVSFLPSAVGTRNGGLTIYGNVQGGQATATLSGVAIAGANIVLNPLSLVFGNTAVGAASAAQNITISNTGGTQANLQTPVVTGDFKISASTCGASLLPSVGCTVSITFNPTITGARTGTFSIKDDAGTQTAALSGTGFAPATDGLSPLSLAFAPQQLNSASAAQQATLTNTGDAALTLIAAQITSGDFTAVNSCGNSLAGHASCAISVSFVPKNVGAETGQMTVLDEFRTQTVTLNGTGLAPPGVSMAPASPVAFGTIGVGLASSPQIITLTNNGGVPLQISSMNASGDFALVAGKNGCIAGSGASLAPNASCTAQVVFSPTAGGRRTGLLTVADNAANSPQSLQLTGTGVDFTWAANGPTSVTVASGQPAAYSLTLAPPNGATGLAAGQAVATIACSGAPANAICSLSQQTADLSVGTTVTVTLSTGVVTASMEFPRGWGRYPQGTVADRRGTMRASGLPAWFALPAGSGLRAGPEPAAWKERADPAAKGGYAPEDWLALALPLALAGKRRAGREKAGKSGARRTRNAKSLPKAESSIRGSQAETGEALSADAPCQSSRSVALVPARVWHRSARVAFFVFCAGTLLFALGCGTGRLIPSGSGTVAPGTPTTPTPAGTYTVTVSATYSGLVRTEQLTLVVQ